MFEPLRAEVDALDVPVDGAAITALLEVRDRLDAKLSQALGAFDVARLWDLDGATSLTAWLRDRAQLGRRAAGRASAVARRLRALPRTTAAWIDGRLRSAQVDAVVAVLTDRTLARFALDETDLLPLLEPLDVNDTERALEHWAATVDDVAPPDESTSDVHLSPTLDGRWRLDGTLDSLSGAIVSTALRVASTDDLDGEPRRCPGARRADALVDVCRWFLDHQHEHVARRHRPHVNVIIDPDHHPRGRVVHGPQLDPVATDALLCDSVLHRLVLSPDSVILDYGRATRTIPAPLWNAIVARDHHCRFPGCDRPATWCEAHHVTPWRHGGHTSPDNLVLLCSRHHHHLHHPAWHAKLRPDGELEITAPDGRHRTSRPPSRSPTPSVA